MSLDEFLQSKMADVQAGKTKNNFIDLGKNINLNWEDRLQPGGVWSLDVGSLDILEDNKEGKTWFKKKYPGKTLNQVNKTRVAKEYTEHILDRMPVGQAVQIKGHAIQSQNKPGTEFGKGATGKAKDSIYNRWWGDKPGFRSHSDGSLIYEKPMSTKMNNRAMIGAEILPDADGIYRIDRSQLRQLKVQMHKAIANNPDKPFSKEGLGFTDRIEIDGELRDIRWKGKTTDSKNDVNKWNFDRVDQKKAALKLRNDRIKAGTLTIEEFQEGASQLFTEEGIEEGGKINHNGKRYTKDQFAKLKFKGYKTKLRTGKLNIKQLVPMQRHALGISGPATGGHINAPGTANFIESDLNYMAEQGRGPQGNFANQNIVRSKSAMKALGVNQTRQQFIQNELRGTQRRFSDLQKAVTVKGGGPPVGGVTQKITTKQTPSKVKVKGHKNRARMTIGDDLNPSTRKFYDPGGYAPPIGYV